MGQSWYSAVVLAVALLGLGHRPLVAQDAVPPTRLEVRSLDFEGNRAIDDATLAAAIATTRSSWFRRSMFSFLSFLGTRRYFDEREFRRDVLRLRLLYHQSGYVDAQVDTLVRRDARNVRITFLIHEGEPVRVTELALSGLDTIIDVSAVRRLLPLTEGAPFNRFLLQASTDTLVSLFKDRGYPWVEVFRSFTVIDSLRAARVSFDVLPGPRARIGAIQIDGAEHLGEATVRKLVPLREGDIFRQRNLATAQRDLYRVEALTYANVSLADSHPSGPGDTLVTVVVQVAEGDLYGVRAGVGYGTIDCFRALAGWRAHNFLGGGRQLDLTGRVAKVGTGSPFDWDLDQRFLCGVLEAERASPERLELNYDVTATFTQPYFFGRRNAISVIATAEKRAEFSAYLREAIGGELAVTRTTRWDIPVTLSWSVSRGRTVAAPAIFCSFLNVCRVEDTELFTQYRVESMLGLRAVRDRTSDPVNPLTGSLLRAELRYAAPAIGSDSLIQFVRGVGELAFYHRVGRRTVFAWRIRAGGLLAPQLGLAGQNVRFVPPDQRFYAGGPNSVRGYGQNQLGPLVRVVDPEVGDSTDDGFVPDTVSSPTGGNSFFVANVELRMPFPLLADNIQAGLFVDVGQVIERGNELFPLRTIAITPGVGMRIASPLGAIRLDIAFNPRDPAPGPLYVREGDTLTLVDSDFAPGPPSSVWGRLQVHFAVGHAF